MPIIVRTISIFTQVAEVGPIVVAVHADMLRHATELIDDFHPRRVIVTTGGAERQESIELALKHPALAESEIVLVHDAVRPFTTSSLVRGLIENAREFGAAIPGLEPKETIKQVDRNGFVQQTYKRSSLISVQTPQAFRRELLIEAYEAARMDNISVTDDASVVEYAGYPVKVIPGEEDNIKITTPRDWELAEKIAAQRIA